MDAPHPTAMATRTSKASSKKKTGKRAAKAGGTRAKAGGKGSGDASRPRVARKAGAQVAAAGGTRASRNGAADPRSIFLPRAIASNDDDDALMANGGGGGGFGRCGGRSLSNRLEQQLCHRLGIAGVVHSHSPRHYEIRYEDGKVAAYAPMVVLRGRGREGKGVVIEAIEDPKAAILRKIVAFRGQYGTEFYVILVATDEVLDGVPLAAYDESCSSTNVNTLIARLAE